MSLSCFRSLPGRLSSLVNGRKPSSRLDRHRLREHVESSVFLKQFLGTQRALSLRANTADKPSIPYVSCILHPNLSFASLDTCNQWNKKVNRQYIDDKTKSETTYWGQSLHRLHNRSQRSNVALSKNRKYITPIGIASNNVTVFQRQDVVGNDKNNSFLDNNRLSSLENLYSWESNIDRNILLTSDDKNILKTSPQPSPLQDNEGKPSQEQLQSIVDTLSKDLPNLFVKPQNFSIYTKDFIFINNIRGVTTRGITDYAKQLILLRVIGHIRFAHVKLNILKLTTHSDDGTIKIRWRIRGVTGWKVISMFWRYKIWKIQDAIDAYHDIWYDGFSTYYINGDGKVYKHVADKVMPDQDIVAKKDDLRMAPKLALFKNLLDNATRTSLN
ncbi:Uncharacterized protein C6orf136-like protein [Camponotus floridanus]|uniref:Uncharacterized protein C6orf136-like protein n=1 Tax=Camponotus floridanus TaxID=104421 RepID=E2A8N0_CAMFO|nr:uncharacterized protein LOC105249594 isoform X1 [Camponotus floridanus]EFN70217.1 Uncharacterized protein C6orf136-like protein [Camponotus floridanus]